MDDEDTGPPPLDGDLPEGPLAHTKGGGDVVLLLGLPQVFIIGYDCISFTAKHFAGVRDVPRGPHFFWLSPVGGGAARSGFWCLGSDAQDVVHVSQWDRYNEVLRDSPTAESFTQASSVDDIHHKLVPFAAPGSVGGSKNHQNQAEVERGSGLWKQLSSAITAPLLDRIIGRGRAWNSHTSDRVKGATQLHSEIELDAKLSSAFQSRELGFSFPQTSKIFSAANSGSARTLDATDATTYILKILSEQRLDDSDLIGELQFAYVVGMHLGNDSCLQQWWYLVLKLVLKAYNLLLHKPSLAAALLRTLAVQLAHSAEWLEAGGSVLDNADSSQTRDFRLGLTVYKRRLDEVLAGEQTTPDLMAAGAAYAKLEVTLVELLGWDLRGDYLRRGKVMLEDGEEVDVEMSELQAEDERGEWAPEVVDVDESGRPRDLISL